MEAPGQPEEVSMDEEKLLKEIKTNLRLAKNHRAEWRAQAVEDYDFFSGEQWSEEDKQKLDDEKRPAVVFNRIVRTINAVSGIEVQNRQEVRYFPRRVDANANPQDLSESGFSDQMNAASKWVRDQNGAEDEESEAFQDTLICGEGWTETRMDYEMDAQGMILKDRIDPLCCFVDPNSKKRNYEDAKFLGYVKDFTVKEVKELWPDAPITGTGSFWGDSVDNTGDPHDADDAWKYENDQSDKIPRSGMVPVVLYQYSKMEDAYLVIGNNGESVTISKKKFDMARELITMQSIRAIKIKRRAFYQCILIGEYLAEHNQLKCNDFTLKCITGLRDRNRGTWFGLIKLMKDPQRWANKWLSQIQYILNSNAKGGYFVEDGAVKNIRKFEDQVSNPSSVTQLNPGGMGKIKEKISPPYPDGIDRLLNYAIAAVNDIPGVNLEIMGQADRNQPMGLELTRKNSSITVMANFFDALRRYRKADGKLLAFYIREYLADGRLIRIIGKQGAQYLPLIKDKMAFDYDIVVDEAPTSPNVKERNFAILMQLIPLAMQAGLPVPPEVLDYSPLSEDLIQKWKQVLMPDPEQQQKQQQQQQELEQIQKMLVQLDMMEKQAMIQKIGSETVKNYAVAEKEKSVANEQEALAMQKFGMLHADQYNKDMAMQKDQDRKDLELVLNQQRKLLEVRMDAMLRARKELSVPSLSQIQ